MIKYITIAAACALVFAYCQNQNQQQQQPPSDTIKAVHSSGWNYQLSTAPPDTPAGMYALTVWPPDTGFLATDSTITFIGHHVHGLATGSVDTIKARRSGSPNYLLSTAPPDTPAGGYALSVWPPDTGFMS